MKAGRGLALVLLAGGCVGPKPPLPPSARIVAPPAWRTASGPTEPIAADWWCAFGDPVLTGLVQQALAGNDDVAIAASRVEEARAAERLSRAALSPQVNAGATAAEARTLSGFGVPYTALAGQPSISASYDPDLFGRLRAASQAARARLLASAAARDTVRLAIVAQVAGGYVTLRSLDARLAVARDTLAARGEALRIAQRRATTGYTSALELHQAEGEYHAAEQLVPQLELAITRQEDALGVLIGATPGAIARGLALEALIQPAIPDGLPADLLRRRPDLEQAEETLVAADRGLDSARAALLPSVTLTGSAGLLLSEVLADPIGVFSLGGSVLAPLLDGGRLRAQADVAAAQRDQAAFSYHRVALTAFREVEDSLAGVRRSGEQVAALAAQRDALAAALRNASNRYRAGYSSYLDQLDAQRGLFTAELSLVQARADRELAYVSLYQAMGGGWSGASVYSPRR
jgi:multidrug efflux system outer membrane protein